jgi:ketosteroid isomerase-like protein
MAYKKTWDLFFEYSPGGEGSFDLVELKITAGETIAFCHALLRIGGETPMSPHYRFAESSRQLAYRPRTSFSSH